jgi:hypothetical protein
LLDVFRWCWHRRKSRRRRPAQTAQAETTSPNRGMVQLLNRSKH